MRKEITKEGNSQRIRITKEDMKNHGLSVGDFIEFTITKIIHPEELKNA